MRPLILILLIACSSDSKSPEPKTGDPAAGKVVELTGKVTATAADVTRTLAVGQSVGSSDMIETAPDASAVIVLSHNNARWSLEGGMRTRVDQSVAWTLPKQEAAPPVDHATSSAGRHADRQAADTQITAERDEAARRQAAEEARQNSQNDADREAAKAKLQALRKEQAEMERRLAEAKAAAAKAERRKGVKISKECMDNPLARGCDGPEPEDEVKATLARLRLWADEICACKDKECAAKVDANHGRWRAEQDKKYPPSSPKGKEIAAGALPIVKRYDECKAKLP